MAPFAPVPSEGLPLKPGVKVPTSQHVNPPTATVLARVGRRGCMTQLRHEGADGSALVITRTRMSRVKKCSPTQRDVLSNAINLRTVSNDLFGHPEIDLGAHQRGNTLHLPRPV
jgi:hypothetical protein